MKFFLGWYIELPVVDVVTLSAIFVFASMAFMLSCISFLLCFHNTIYNSKNTYQIFFCEHLKWLLALLILWLLIGVLRVVVIWLKLIALYLIYYLFTILNILALLLFLLRRIIIFIERFWDILLRWQTHRLIELVIV